LGKPIPVYLTAQGDEAGEPVPCGCFALIGIEQVGQAVIEAIGDSQPGCLKITACSQSVLREMQRSRQP